MEKKYIIEIVNDSTIIVNGVEHYNNSKIMTQEEKIMLSLSEELGFESSFFLNLNWEEIDKEYQQLEELNQDEKYEPSEETFKIWLGNFVSNFSNTFSNTSLTKKDVEKEIEEVKGTIENEKIFASVSNAEEKTMHLCNIKEHEYYIYMLEEIKDTLIS